MFDRATKNGYTFVMRIVWMVGLLLGTFDCGGMLADDIDANTSEASLSEASDASDASTVDEDAASACAMIDAGNCKEGQHILACGHGICVTDQDTCPIPGADACVSVCDAGEYGAACGGGVNGNESPPSSQCHEVAALMSGLVMYCCPCE